MAKFLDTQSLYYDDVNLIAQNQRGPVAPQSREKIPKELHRIFVAPMSSVIGLEFAEKAASLGLSMCIHRFNDVGLQKEILQTALNAKVNEDQQIFAAVGLWDYTRRAELGYDKILIDVANGYMNDLIRFAKSLQSDGHTVMVGNVHSVQGVDNFSNSLIRCGIGNGSVCKTGDASGYTRGQVTELYECCLPHVKAGGACGLNNKIIADGGIKDGGCAAKAFGLGADYIMIGGVLSCAAESYNVINGLYKYWGGASDTQQILQYGEKRRHSEGREVSIDRDKIMPLENIIKEFWGGLSSGISYSGYDTLTEFIGNGVFEVKHSR